MSDIVAWLLEQITDDEKSFAAGTPEEEHWATYEAGDYNEGYIVMLHERLRAECAAKRAIIRWWRDVYDSDERMGLETALECLAQVYADRPGFDPAWATP